MPVSLSSSAFLHRLACLALFIITGCTGLFYDDRCGPESRDVSLAEQILQQGDSIGLVVVNLSESKREDIGESVEWYIWGDFLRGHLESARLVASESPGSTLLPLSGAPAEPPDIVLQGQLMPYTGPADFNQLFTRATHGGLTIVLETDIPDRPVIALPLVQMIQFNDWGRAHCS